MNYQKIYNQLIAKRQVEILSKKEVYCETHHIIPKCLGGSNEDYNLVNLTAREHFLAHWLLHRIYPENSSLTHAFFQLSIGNSSKRRNFYPSSRAYEEARIAFSISQSNKLKNVEKIKCNHCDIIATRSRINRFHNDHCLHNTNFTEEQKQNEINRRKSTENTKKKQSISKLGRIKSEQECNNISNALKDKNKSKEHVANMVISLKNQLKIKCEHCGLNIIKTNYIRWHGDNCKHNLNLSSEEKERLVLNRRCIRRKKYKSYKYAKIICNKCYKIIAEKYNSRHKCKNDIN